MEGRQELALSTAAPPPSRVSSSGHLKFFPNLGQVSSSRDSKEDPCGSALLKACTQNKPTGVWQQAEKLGKMLSGKTSACSHNGLRNTNSSTEVEPLQRQDSWLSLPSSVSHWWVSHCVGIAGGRASSGSSSQGQSQERSAGMSH